MKAVLFDMDGVLIDSEPLWKIAEVEAFAKVGLDLTHTDCEETVGLRIDEVVQLWYDKVGWKEKTVKEVETDIVDILIREIRQQGRTLPGVKDTLDRVQKAGLKIGLATSSYQRIIEVVVDKLQIRHYFDTMHSAEYETYGKPHPAVFLSCAKQLQVHPEECLVIEDSYNGIKAATAAKMKVVAVPEKTHQTDPRFLSKANMVIDSLCNFDLNTVAQLWD